MKVSTKIKMMRVALSTLLSLLKHKNKLKAITSQSDVLARATIEEFDDNGEKKARYILNEPSNTFETKIRHSPSITINDKKFVNPSISQVVEVIRNGN